MGTYRVLSPVKYAGRRWEVGEAVSLTDDDAEALLESGVVEATAEAAAAGQAASSTGSQEGGVPEASREERLRAAIIELKPEDKDPEQWTKSGKPEVRALESMSGLEDVTAAERDAAWSAYRGEQGEGE